MSGTFFMLPTNAIYVMSYTSVNYRETDGETMHFLREPLECEELGITVVDCDPDWHGKPHDHVEEGQEEVYFLIEGEASVVVDGDEVSMQAGDAIRVSPDATREIQNGAEPSRFVIAGAP